MLIYLTLTEKAKYNISFIFKSKLFTFADNFNNNVLFQVSVTSLERRFKLTSADIGLIISTYDVAGMLSTLPISYMGKCCYLFVHLVLIISP